MLGIKTSFLDGFKQFKTFVSRKLGIKLLTVLNGMGIKQARYLHTLFRLVSITFDITSPVIDSEALSHHITSI